MLTLLIFAVIMVALIVVIAIIGSRRNILDDVWNLGRNLGAFNPNDYKLNIFTPKLPNIRASYLEGVKNAGKEHGFENRVIDGYHTYAYLLNSSALHEINDTEALAMYRENFAKGEAKFNKLKAHYAN